MPLPARKPHIPRHDPRLPGGRPASPSLYPIQAHAGLAMEKRGLQARGLSGGRPESCRKMRGREGAAPEELGQGGGRVRTESKVREGRVQDHGSQAFTWPSEMTLICYSDGSWKVEEREGLCCTD